MPSFLCPFVFTLLPLVARLPACHCYPQIAPDFPLTQYSWVIIVPASLILAAFLAGAYFVLDFIRPFEFPLTKRNIGIFVALFSYVAFASTLCNSFYDTIGWLYKIVFSFLLSLVSMLMYYNWSLNERLDVLAMLEEVGIWELAEEYGVINTLRNLEVFEVIEQLRIRDRLDDVRAEIFARTRIDVDYVRILYAVRNFFTRPLAMYIFGAAAMLTMLESLKIHFEFPAAATSWNWALKLQYWALSWLAVYLTFP